LAELRPDPEAIVSDMHRVSELNAYSVTAAAVATLCSTFLFVHGIRNRGRTD
jgi:hypothetical protein